LDCILPCIGNPGSSEGPAAKGFTLGKPKLSFTECIGLIQKDKVLRKSFEGAIRIAL